MGGDNLSRIGALMNQDQLFGPLALAVAEAVKGGQDDEEALEPLVRVDGAGKPLALLSPGGPVVFANLRGERERELTRALTDPEFTHFPRPASFAPLPMATLIDYGPGLNAEPLYRTISVEDGLARVVSRAGLRQIRMGETEKAIHMTYFLSGKTEEVLPGEEREFVETEQGQGFGFAPEMKAAQVAEAVVRRLEAGVHDLVMVNLANTDVVNHVEDEAAVIKAVETVDAQVGRLAFAARENGYRLVLTADHGSAERWYYEDGSPDTGHTDSLVPFILADPYPGAGPLELRPDGDLTDVAPSVLGLLGLEPPASMTGRNLISGSPDPGRVLLLICDGWGVREETFGNLIARAATPEMDRLMAENPWTTLAASGPRVGMPQGTVGNSEVGHLHIGAGRVVDSDRLRINKEIESGAFYQNPVLGGLIDLALESGKALNVLGIASFYSSHGSLDHLFAILEAARRRGLTRVHVQAMLGRRGEKARSGPHYVSLIEKTLAEKGQGPVGSVIGRHWSLDREENWDRIEKTFNLYVLGRGRKVFQG